MLVVSVTYEMKTSTATVLFSLLLFVDVLSAERDGKSLMLTFISMLVVGNPATCTLERKFYLSTSAKLKTEKVVKC